MPHRFLSAAILLAWSLATGALIVRDVMPDLLIGPPPDLRSISLAESRGSDQPTRWAILVADDAGSVNFRSIGQVVTRSYRQADGDVRMTSEAWFDAAEALKGTPLAASGGAGGSERVEVRGSYDVDSSGNLNSFWAAVKLGSERQDGITLNGRVRKNHLEITAEGPMPWLNWKKSLRYEPRGIVQNALGPMDRMPGLQVGQRWNSRIVSPITGGVQEVRVEVARKRIITWDSNPVTTLEVVTHVPPLTARTWVRPDGVVLRQEAPFPFVKLILERQPDRPPGEAPEDMRR